ncbi:MAG: hypothetical protein AB1898_23555 [Acidobacteriota bacterium]
MNSKRMVACVIGLTGVMLGLAGSFDRWLLAEDSAAVARIAIDAHQRFQHIDGFGVNFNGPYFREAQTAMVDRLIDDLGATIFRVDVYGDDLSNWELVNDNDDATFMNWEFYNNRYSMPNFEASWALGRYLNSKGARVLPSLIGVVLEWMLDSNNPPRPGVTPGTQKPHHLNPGMYEEFAEMVASMALYARTRAHVDFEYLSPFNEIDWVPSEGPSIEPEEAPKVLGILARRLNKEGLGDIRLVVVEQASLRSNYAGPILEDPELMKQVGIFSFHTYGEDPVRPQVERVARSRYPHTRVWLTEYGASDRDRSFENEWKNQSLGASRRVLRALNEGVQAALFWDAFDNFEACEMRLSYFGLMRNDNHFYSPKKRYYAAKQLYHFVRPGSQRIGAQTNVPGLTVSAFRDVSSDAVVIVGVKEGGPGRIQIDLAKADSSLEVLDVYQTTRNLDCIRVATVPITKQEARIDLPDEVVFTLVGKQK